MQMLFESRKCNHVQHESNTTHTNIYTNSQISAILKLKTAKNTKRQKQNNAASCENLKLHNEIDARNVQRPSCSPKPPPDPSLFLSLSLSRWQMPQKKLKSWQSLRLRLPTIVAAPSLQLATCGTDAIELVGAVSYRSLCDRRNSA